MLSILKLAFLLILSFTARSQNEFAFDLYSKMDVKTNLFYSPTSIKTAFAMAYEGANSSTQVEFEKIFGFEENNEKFFAQTEYLKGAAEIVNSTWILEKYQILPSYISKMESSFDAKPYYTDFKNDPEGSAKKINEWIEKSTKGMIKKMLKPTDVESFKMALVNAIYFKQDWKFPFEKEQTVAAKFTNLNGTKPEIDMMHAERSYKAYEGNLEQVIELPYGDDKTSMVVILPKDMKTYQLTNASYTALLSKLGNQLVNLDFPKFTFETPTFELKPYLQQLGMVSAFEDYADFSGMRKEKDLKIGTALHKAKIIVNEEGTEAAAVTVIGMVETTSAHHTPPLVMKITVDKPFYYFIKDNETGTILFMGRMNEMSPKEQ
jgi:serine protease inhibitor